MRAAATSRLALLVPSSPPLSLSRGVRPCGAVDRVPTRSGANVNRDVPQGGTMYGPVTVAGPQIPHCYRFAPRLAREHARLDALSSAPNDVNRLDALLWARSESHRTRFEPGPARSA